MRHRNTGKPFHARKNCRKAGSFSISCEMLSGSMGKKSKKTKQILLK